MTGPRSAWKVKITSVYLNSAALITFKQSQLPKE